MEVAAVLLFGINHQLNENRRRLHRQLRLRLRHLRDTSNPFDVDELYFKNLYKLTPALTQQLIEILEPALAGVRRTKIPVHLQVLTALRFFASGTYQKGLSQNFLHPSSQSSVSRIIHRVAAALEAISQHYIRFPQTREERRHVSNRFTRRNPIRGILGLIDCFVVKMIRPSENKEAFFNYRHGSAVNVQMICDARYVSQNIRVCPGRSNDQHIWNNSEIKDYMESLRTDPAVYGHEGFYYLLGDSGYTCSPIMLTPILDADEHTPEWRYTDDHTGTRCQAEQTIGMLSTIWRCISRRRVLQYKPETVATFIIASAVLHNYRLLNGIPFPQHGPEPVFGPNNRLYNGNYQAGFQHRSELIRAYYH